MARDQQPITDEELEKFQESMEEQAEELREALAEDLGGKPEDYNHERYSEGREGEAVTDGSGE